MEPLKSAFNSLSCGVVLSRVDSAGWFRTTSGEIVQEMVNEAFALLSSANKFTASSKL